MNHVCGPEAAHDYQLSLTKLPSFWWNKVGGWVRESPDKGIRTPSLFPFKGKEAWWLHSEESDQRLPIPALLPVSSGTQAHHLTFLYPIFSSTLRGVTWERFELIHVTYWDHYLWQSISTLASHINILRFKISQPCLEDASGLARDTRSF